MQQHVIKSNAKLQISKCCSVCPLLTCLVNNCNAKRNLNSSSSWRLNEPFTTLCVRFLNYDYRVTKTKTEDRCGDEIIARKSQIEVYFDSQPTTEIHLVESREDTNQNQQTCTWASELNSEINLHNLVINFGNRYNSLKRSSHFLLMMLMIVYSPRQNGLIFTI